MYLSVIGRKWFEIEINWYILNIISYVNNEKEGRLKNVWVGGGVDEEKI